MLIEHKEIEWKGNLRKTFNYYLHPDNIEKTKSAIYKMLGSGEILDLFQFSTEVGIQASKKVKPSNLLEVASTNSLIRLMSEDEEQPIDTFIKFKNDISLWYKEMRDFGLNEDEIKILEKHLLKLNGIADTQESVMLLSMDENIAGFDVKWGNKLRKAIAKKKQDAIDEVHKKFYASGEKLGTRKELLDYVWNIQIKRQLGYSFSLLHTLAYSLVAIQELNLNYKFNPLYWQTACLTVNSGGQENEMEDGKTKSTNYGKIATAIGNIRKKGVKVALPEINKATFGFSPDIEHDQIIFGLKGINGIGDDVVYSIIENRPYTSFDDFLTRMFNTKIIKNGQMVQLIKGGCFDSFGDRKEIMKQFVLHTFKPKEKLNMQNMPMLVEKDLLPEEYQLEKRFFNYKKYISQFVYKTIAKPKDKLLKLNDISQLFFEQHFSEDSVVEMSDDGYLVISENKFKKEYDKKMEGLKEWLSKEETVQYINEKLFNELWDEYNKDSLSKWEMESLSFYYHEHELAKVNNEKYDISLFSELPEAPVVVREYESRGIPRKEFQLQRIAGTVLDKDKNKHQVTVLTTDGVVVVKFYAGAFSHYNKQISRSVSKDRKEILEKSWFTRGNKLLITGFRCGEKFFPRTYKNSIYQHTVALIKEIDQNGNLVLQTERIKI